MQTHGGSGGRAPFIPTVGTRWSVHSWTWDICFTARPLYLGGATGTHFGVGKNLSPAWNRTPSPYPIKPSRNKPNELQWRHISYCGLFQRSDERKWERKWYEKGRKPKECQKDDVEWQSVSMTVRQTRPMALAQTRCSEWNKGVQLWLSGVGTEWLNNKTGSTSYRSIH